VRLITFNLFALLMLVPMAGNDAFAQAAPADRVTDPVIDDDAVRQTVRQILSQPEFAEFTESDTRSFWEAIRRLVKALVDMFEPDEKKITRRDARPFSLPLPSAWVLMVLLLLALGLVLAYVLSGRKPTPDTPDSGDAAPEQAAAIDPREQAPSVHLERAARLAREGDYRRALRALYLATLIALDRRRLISFEPNFTNRMYVRRMPRGETRRLFSELTRTFDHKWYGDEPTSESEYHRCGELAARICSRKGDR
jgi:hypothetical protein